MENGSDLEGPGQPRSASAELAQPSNYLALIGAFFLTLILVPMALANLHPWGTRGALASLQWPAFCAPRWLCLSLALGTGLKVGRFDWLPGRLAVRFLVVMGMHFGMGLASLFCLIAMSEESPPVPWWLHVLAVLTSLAVPAVVMIFLTVPWRTAAAWRTLLVAGVLIDAAAGAAIGWYYHLDTLEAQRTEAVRRAEQDAQEQAALAQLDQLPPDAPLERWLPFTRPTGMLAVNTRAAEAIRVRPHLTEELAASLRSSDPQTRALSLRFVHDGLTPPLADELLSPVREALNATAAAMRARAETQPDLNAETFYQECLEATDLPDRFPDRAAEFVIPVREMRAVVGRMPNASEPPMGQQELDDWLRRHDPTGTR